MTEDKIAAYTTLYTVLVTMAKLSAPFTPFMAESIYQNLVPNFYKDAPKSVHLCAFPNIDENAIDKALEEGMQNVLDIVVLGRACRNTANIKNRQPLSKIFVCSERKTELTEGLLEIAKDELNVKGVEYLRDASKFVTYKIKPQLKTLGPKYGANLGKIRKFFEVCDANALVTTVKSGKTFKTEFEGVDFEFTLDDLLISTESAEGFIAASDMGITVVMDTTVTEELKAEGIERELISKIQSMRKEAEFEVVDRITVNFITNDEGVKKALVDGKELKKVVLADAVTEGNAEGFTKELDINGAACTVIINKVNK
jgi:isoleucyl-tRNA synthetase